MHEAGHGETVERLRALNGVAARDDRAGLIGLVVAAAQNILHGLLRHAGRETHDIERELRLAAHGVYVAQRVRRRDLAEKERIVHNGREKVGRLHERGIFVEYINARIVALVVADDEAGVGMRPEAVEQPRERAGADLRAAACARGELCQLYFGFHGKNVLSGRAVLYERHEICVYYSINLYPVQKTLVFCGFIRYNDRSIYITLHREV